MNKIKKVLFVCMGNTARSPAAEYLAKGLKKQYKKELEEVYFTSAGFFNAFNYAQPETTNYLKSKGIDSSDFIPQIINKNLLENQDLILTMEYSHSRDIKNNYPNIKDIDAKVFTLKEFAGETRDIDIIDPYYTSRSVYYKVLNIIDDYVNKVVNKIIEINKLNSN
ncbi:MAG: low molecular weight protein arginine phosphatase [Candidatus Hodarchaeota archaeon]